MRKSVVENMLEPDDFMISSRIIPTKPLIEKINSNKTNEFMGSPTGNDTMPHIDEYDTGDILLFSDKTFIPSLMVEYFSGSKYSHAGMVLKDPIYIGPELKGLYILESTAFSEIHDSENDKFKFGVQIRPLIDVCKDYDGAIFWRKLNIERNEQFYKTIEDAHKTIHDKPYDYNILDWLGGLLNVHLGDIQRTTQFFCSALVTYVYYRLGCVDENTPWSIIRPKDLGTEFSMTPTRIFPNDVCRIKIINCVLDKEIMVKSYDLYLHYIYRTY